MTVSLVILTPHALRDQADAALARLGWGEDNFHVALGPEATVDTTHFGLRATVSHDFTDALHAEFTAFGGGVLIDARADADRMGHFDSVLNANGLRRIERFHVV